MPEINNATAPYNSLHDIDKSYQMQSPGFSVLVDVVSKRIVFFEEKFTEKFGYTGTDIYSQDFSLTTLIDEIQLERLDLQIDELKEGQLNRFTGYPLIAKSGETVMCYIYVYPVPHVSAEKLIQLYILPEFSKMEAPFISYDTRELFLEQFNTFDFGTFEWIIPTDRVFWSDGVYKIYDMEDSKVNPDTFLFSKFTHPDDKDRILKMLKTTIDSCADFDIELKIITPKGNVKVVQTSGNVIVDGNNKPLKLVGSIRDVTRQRLIENSLEEKIEELNESNAELEEFAYIASHDLQEPLRKISTFCDRLSERYTNELAGDGKMYMERIMASADNMRMLIHNLLEFSRISKTNEPLTEVNLNVVMREVVNELELLIDETGSVVHVHDLPKTFCSIVLMKQLFSNLINNAIKFRKEGVRSEINISSSKLTNSEKTLLYLEPSTEYYDIVVKDNGIGFDNEYAIRIFQIFQRLHGKSEYPGSGIGLAICKKIVDKHKGYIYAEGNEGAGAVFHIVLPVDPEKV